YVKDKTIHLYFEKVAREIGPIGRVQLFWNDLYIVTDAALAKEISGDLERFGRAKASVATFGQLGKNTVITLEGEPWKKHRKVISAAFTNSHLTASITEINQTIDGLFTLWDTSAASHTPVEIYSDLSTLALEALGRAVLGVDFALLARRSGTFTGTTTSNGVEKTGKLLDTIMAGMTRRSYGAPRSMWGFIKDGMPDALVEIREIVTRVVEAKQRELEVGKTDKTGKEDLLTRVLKDTE
ncbi:lanosterol 14-alpha-demethylase, partial [Borealophlyctis nickersoniae]